MAPEQRTLPGNPAGAVYGTVLVAGQLAIESGTDHGVGTMLLSLGATLLVFWFAHAYTDALGGVIRRVDGERPSLAHALREEWPIVESGVLPALALAIAAGVGASASDAAVTGLVVANVELVGWAALAARRTDETVGRKVLFTVVAGVLGLVIVALKYLLH